MIDIRDGRILRGITLFLRAAQRVFLWAYQLILRAILRILRGGDRSVPGTTIPVVFFIFFLKTYILYLRTKKTILHTKSATHRPQIRTEDMG